ncbi:MAG TPA: multicopper oxidase domain-containing protein [Gemmatimonadaceae bacterium]|nr:multicopper oxidase domain-containing protein [Gemmatimonadaceae bacterium]
MQPHKKHLDAPKPAEKSPSPERPEPSNAISRRRFVRAGIGAGALGVAAVGLTQESERIIKGPRTATAELEPHTHEMMMPSVVGEVDHVKNRFNPSALLSDFDQGKITTLPTGQILHEYVFVVQNQTIEIVPGLEFAAWTYNGRIPGPTIRVTEGDRVRVALQNAGDHAHSIHFHGVHPGNMDGVFDAQSGVVAPGGTYVYEFDAEPFGTHLYHCHTAPLAKHIAKGLYGAFIIDPKGGRPPVDREMVMVMSGYDVDFDGANDFYQVNGIPFHYDHDKNPIKLKVGERVRIHLINALEFDQSNSFHLHANFFHYYPTGTSMTPSEFTDTVALMQGQRGILEFSYRYPGRYMFHAHKTEFAELGWTGVFDVEP